MSKERKGILDPKKEIPQSLIKVNSIEEVIENEIKKFDIREKDIETAIAAYGSLQIMGIDDKDGYEAVYQARVIFRNMRTAIEKRRVELKADSVKIGNAIDAEAKRLTAKFIETEKFLAGQVKAVDDEKERIKREEKEKVEIEKRQKIEGRVNRLRDIGFVWENRRNAFISTDGFEFIGMTAISEWSDEDFEAYHLSNKAKYNDWLITEQKRKAEQERIRQEEELARKAEAERLAEEREKIEILNKALMEAEEKLAKQQIEQQAKVDELRQKEEELRKAQVTLVADPASENQPVSSGRIPIGAIKSEDLKPYHLDSAYGHMKDISTKILGVKNILDESSWSDKNLDKLRKDTSTLLGKTTTFLIQGLETWRVNQK